tara:strand:+ start:397 stop:585 length:189 start_codon:yes stop_codon:yes gene_type:complete
MTKLNDDEVSAILDQIIDDVGYLDYTSIYQLLENLVEIDSEKVNLLLKNFVSEHHTYNKEDT